MTKTKPAPEVAPKTEAPASLTSLEVAVKGMTASAKVITDAVAAATKTDETKRSVSANVMHLEYMLKSDLVKSSKTDIKQFTDAAAAGKAFLI